jgi:hypothetical protein
MAKNPQSKDETLDALDFIVNVLKEHERDLDKLVNELGAVTEQLGNAGELNEKVEKVEEKINNLHKEMTSLIACLSGAPKQIYPTESKDQVNKIEPMIKMQAGPSVILRCKQWEDFQTLAFQAQTLSFSYKGDEKVFQVGALKGNQIFTYTGTLPRLSVILKMWLSKQLDVSDGKILEGALAIGQL